MGLDQGEGREVDVHHLLLIVGAMERAIELQRHNR